MEREIDLATANRDVLIGIIVRQQAVIEGLEKRVARLEGQSKSKDSGRMPGLKPKGDRTPEQTEQPDKEPRKPRRHGFARTRMTPTQRVEHVVEQCPGCGARLSGGWTQRTREVIDLPQVPVQVTEHVYMARTCPLCQRCCVPPAQLEGVALGKQRLGVNLVSLIAALREEARLPFRTIQWYLDTVHGLHLSLGALVDATGKVADRARTELAGIVERIRGSPVVHADETGWREDGQNGYVWTFSTPTQRYFLRRGRGKGVVDEVLGDGFAGVLVSDFYAAYHHYDSPKQRCWAHLLRGHSRPEGPLPQRYPAGPVGWRGPPALPAGCGIHPSVRQTAAQRPTGPGKTPAGALPSLPGRLSGRPGQVMPAHGEAHQGTVRLRVPPGGAAGQQRCRAQPAPAGDQPQNQRGHTLRSGHRRQDGAGVNLRYLAGTRSKPPHLLPTTARLPSTLNCYPGGIQLRKRARIRWHWR